MNCKGRPAKPYRIKKRADVYYGKIDSWSNFKSTGKKKKTEAESVILDWIKNNKQEINESELTRKSLSFFSSGFFDNTSDYIRNLEAKGRKPSEKHLVTRRGLLKTYILPKFGGSVLTEITAAEVDIWLLSLSLSNQTKNHLLSTMNAIFDFAVYLGKLPSNPIRNIKRFSNQSKKRDIFMQSELSTLFPLHNTTKALEIWGNYKWLSFFSILAFTGIRAGEARALTWNDIILHDGNAYISIDKAAKEYEPIGDTKTGKHAVGYIPPTIYQWLQKYKESLPSIKRNSFIYCKHSNDEPVHHRTAYRNFFVALGRAGINIEDRNIVIHSLRHTYTSLLLMNGLDEDTVRLSTQHTPEAMKIYTHPTTNSNIIKLSRHTNAIQSALTG